LWLAFCAAGCGAARNHPARETDTIDLLSLFPAPAGTVDSGARLYTFVRGGEERRTVTLQADSKVSLCRLSIPARAMLTFALAMPFNLGDGATARVYFRSGEGESLLFERSLDPAGRREDRDWREVSIDLSRYAGRSGELVLQASAASGELTGDWIGWGEPQIRVRAPDARFPGHAAGSGE
jgi:hypothetical protein